MKRQNINLRQSSKRTRECASERQSEKETGRERERDLKGERRRVREKWIVRENERE